MQLSVGTRLGPYEIVSRIGAGGMGEVWRGRDTRLDRSVAIKILPAEFAHNTQLRIRFEREAKTISQLNHPHICTLYDVGEAEVDVGAALGGSAGGRAESPSYVSYIVMELLEGESLADRLWKGHLPLSDVLKFGVQIAEALDKAHRQEVVHRDLKPSNIMLTRSGAKLLDFGLAKSSAAVGAHISAPATPDIATEHKPLTQEGTILGTFQYMAPEQLEGQEADARTDIFALGAVLYEMAAGRRAFEGKTRTSLIASIVSGEPRPLSQVQPLAPQALEHVINKCLAKDPDDRWQSAHDIAEELRWISATGSQPGVAAPIVFRRKARERLAWTLAAVATIAAFAVFVTSRRGTTTSPLVVRSYVLPPPRATFISMGNPGGPVAVSPDGTRLVFQVLSSDGKNLLWLRSLNSLAPQPLQGTDGASYPFWSPDSRFIAFFAEGKLKKIDVSGGPPQTVCDAPRGRGGTWNRDGVIIFAPTSRDPLYRTSAAGGAATPLTSLDARRSDYSHRWPFFLPDGSHYLYVVQHSKPGSGGETASILAGSLDSKDAKPIVAANSTVAYADGWLLLWRERTLLAQQFDLKRLSVSGDPTPIAEEVQYVQSTASAIFSVSQNGVLAYQAGTAAENSQLSWVDRKGRQMQLATPPGNYGGFRISPDGTRIAFDAFDPVSGNQDVWIHESARAVKTRLTFGPSWSDSPVWSPDGRQIAFRTARTGPVDLYRKAATGTVAEQLLLHTDSIKYPTSWSPDGKFLAFQSLNAKEKAGWDLSIVSLETGTVTPLLKTPFNEYDAEFSPNGRWIAYVSEESGRPEVYVQSFPGPGEKWQISTAGGSLPRWRRDGKELYFVSSDMKIMKADLGGGTTLQAGTPQELFPIRPMSSGPSYDVAADGERFLVNVPVGDRVSPITLVVNWTAELKRR